jgi:chaperonin cofactor prefoldin
MIPTIDPRITREVKPPVKGPLNNSASTEDLEKEIQSIVRLWVMTNIRQYHQELAHSLGTIQTTVNSILGSHPQRLESLEQAVNSLQSATKANAEGFGKLHQIIQEGLQEQKQTSIQQTAQLELENRNLTEQVQNLTQVLKNLLDEISSLKTRISQCEDLRTLVNKLAQKEPVGKPSMERSLWEIVFGK